jgi:hypothetical protein
MCVAISFLYENSLNDEFCSKANKALTPGNEKRRHERFYCETRIKWPYFNTTNFSPAKAINFSQNGLYFESTHNIPPGSTILIKREIFPSDNSNITHEICLPSLIVAEVKWCQEKAETHDSQFGVGVKYHFPSL